MSVPQATNRPNSAARWQVFVCFLLAGLFLYNPFLNSHRENGNLAICHPTSHRATVGSSELEQFAQQGGLVAPLPDLAVVRVFIDLSAAPPSATRQTADRVVSVLPQTGFSSSLWFRPPPAV